MFTRIIRWCFYLLFILVPLAFISSTSELFEFNKLIITYSLTVIIAAAWIVQMIAAKKIIFRRTLLDIPILVFLGFQFISLLFSIDQHTSWFGYYSRWNGGLISLVTYAVLYWAFVTFMDAKSTLRSLQLALGTAAIISFYAILEHFGHSFSCLFTTGQFDDECWVQDVKSRAFATLGQPNWLAAYLVALVFVPLAKLTDFKITRSQVLNLILFILLFTALMFTRSRSGLLAFGISSAIFGALVLVKEKSKGLMPLGAIAGLVVLLTLVFPNPVRDLVIKAPPPPAAKTNAPVTEIDITESGDIRKIVWTGALHIWEGTTKNFWIGTGPETFTMGYYQYRPLAHNATTEWELLYNKAHNEFLNYLATTGILGLGTYLVLLGFMGFVAFKNRSLLGVALFAGWLTISVTNFWGFSVVIMQILLFLLPAMAIVLNTKNDIVKHDESVWMFLVFIGLASVPLIFIARYWLADSDLANAQKDNKYFAATQQPQYLLTAYQDSTAAYQLNSREPVIASQLSNDAAYLALALHQQSTDSAENLLQISLSTSEQAIQASPFHPNYYKARARSLILLSDFGPQYLEQAAQTLQQAEKISPTDPRLPFNLGVVEKYLGNTAEAEKDFQWALKLKPDFADPAKQLSEMATLSGKIRQ